MFSMSKHKYIHWRAFTGWRSPQLQVQITPLQWGIGGGIGERKIALLIGPIAIAIWWNWAPFESGTR